MTSFMRHHVSSLLQDVADNNSPQLPLLYYVFLFEIWGEYCLNVSAPRPFLSKY